MRATSYILGIVGGAVGVVVHAALLVIFFSHSSGLFDVFVRLCLATMLGLAAVLVAALCRRSTRTLAVLLPVFGILGLFPRPLTWLPAAVLLFAAGTLAVLSLRETTGLPTAPSLPSSSTGTPLHWSEAARLGIVPPPSPPRSPAAETAWSSRRKSTVPAVALVAAVIVIPLSLWTPELASAPTNQTAAETPATLTAAQPTGPRASSGSASANTGGSTSSTTPKAATSTTNPPKAAPGLDMFSDSKRGISIPYPASWRDTDPRSVGTRIFGDRSRAIQKALDDTYVAAAFADWYGPIYEGCYLDFITLAVFNDQRVDVSQLTELRTYQENFIDALRQYYPDVKLVQPFRDTKIGLATGFDYTWSLSVGGQTLLCLDCMLVQNGTLYTLRFAAVQKDWKKYEPIFDQILHTFTVWGTAPIS